MPLAILIIIALAQLPVSLDSRPVPVTGFVVDGSSRPATDVDVWLADALSPDEGHRSGMELWWSTVTRPDEGSTPVLVHVRTDPAGRFTINVPAAAVARRSPIPMSIWAAATGKDARVAWYRLPRIVLADDPPVRIELGPAAHAEIAVFDPNRKPVAGARVIPIRAGGIPIPDPMGQALAATSEASGRATIAGLLPASLAAVRVEATGFGTQIIHTPGPELGIPVSGIPVSGTLKSHPGGITVTLAPVGRVVGRLVAPAGEPIRGVTVRAASQVGGYAGSGQGGAAVVACDPQGRFTIPAIAAGMLTLELEFDRQQGTSLRGEAPKKLVVAAGRSTEVTIPLRATVRVDGLVREKGTERPVAGLKVILNPQLGGDRLAVTDVQGRFTGRIVRGVNQPFGWPVRIPAPFFEPANMIYPRQSMPRRDVGELALSPMTLPRGVDVRGSVVGESNTPVAGAEVEAIWTSADGQAQALLARSDRTGAFTLHGVDPLAELSLTAWDGFAGSPAVTVRAEAAVTRPIALTIGPKNTTPIGGRVVDPAGKPIAGASVRIWRQVRSRTGRVIVVAPIAAEDGSVVLRTDVEGRFRPRRRSPAHAEFCAEAFAPGRLLARSPTITATREPDPSIVLVLRRVRTIEGRVVDRQGQPVAGAVVRQSGDGPMPTETVSGKQGQFRLPGVIEGPALVFAVKDGFRFGFLAVDDGPQPAEVVLARTGEPPAVVYQSLPPALSVEEGKILARRLILPAAEKILRHGKDADKFRFLANTLEINPIAMLERLESITFADADYSKLLRVGLAEVVAREDLDEATELLEASDAADVRAGGYVGICDVRRDLRPDQVKEFLVQAGVNAKSMKSTTLRIPIEAQIADHWLDLGETDRARALLDDALALGRDTVKGIKDGGYSLGQVAEVLARLDLPAALKVIEDLERDVRKNEKSDRSFIFQRFSGHIAYKLAAQSPADAERVLERMPIERGMDRYVAATCSRMATKDLARARRIIETRISRDAPVLRPHALGLMARAIAATDKTTAIRLIDEAYAVLDQLADGGERAIYPGVVEVAAGLLPIVEQIEPDRLAEFLARTLALRPARGDQTDSDEGGRAGTMASLSMMVARYDRRLAARLLEPELPRNGSRVTSFGMDYVTWRLLSALALIDPRRAIEQVEALPDDPAPGTDPNATKNQARTYVARLLALPDADRWRLVYEDFLYLWTPDQRYL